MQLIWEVTDMSDLGFQLWSDCSFRRSLGFHYLPWLVCHKFSINKVSQFSFSLLFYLFSLNFLTMFLSTVKPVLSHSKRRSKFLFFKTDYGLMQVKSIAECSFGPSLSYHFSLRSLFCLFLSGRLRRVLLYMFMCRFIISLSAFILFIFLLCFCLYVYV